MSPKPFDYQEWIIRLNQNLKERGLPQWDFVVNETTSWHPLAKPLQESSLVLISSGGVHLKTQEPYDTGPRGDVTFREVPIGTPQEELMITHRAYDHSDADQDVNCVFPYERLREFEQEGVIGKLSPLGFCFMGRIPSLSAITKLFVPPLVERVKAQRVDAALLVPG